MKQWERLPEAELDVMLTLWHAESPMTVGEIVRELSGVRNWKTATVHVLLDRLGERGFIEADKSGYAHRYYPLVSEAAYSIGETKSLRERFFGGSAKRMIVSMLDTEGLSDADIRELSELLQAHKAGKGKK